jgi:hypothetical protein
MRRHRSPMSDSKAPKGDELSGDLTSMCRWTDKLACRFGVRVPRVRFNKLQCLHCWGMEGLVSSAGA